MTVSVIVPIYHGKKYIENLIHQAEECQKKVKEDIQIELVLSNDDPKESLDEYISKNVEIVVLNTNVNRGIQGARVQGLKQCKGDYVVFLDQDDSIYPNYVGSQIQAIGEADAVVCRTINEGKLKYNETQPFEKLITKEYMLSKGNPIVSTGAVLIKRKSIPNEWIENLIRENGADDYFLWLCMVGKKQKFALNQEVLFERVVTGANTSLDSLKMMKSEQEMFAYLKGMQMFSDDIMNELQTAIDEKRLRLLDKFRKMFFILNSMMQTEESGQGIWRFLKKFGIKNIAIYGAGYVGQRLYSLLADTDINVECFVDQNADYIEMPVKVCKFEEITNMVEAIIVTLADNPEKMVERLKEKYPDKKVISIVRLLDSIGNKFDKSMQ